MRRMSCLLGTMMLISLTVCAQDANPLSADIKQGYERIKKNLLATADKVPEEDYSFKPTPAVRSLGEVLEHTAMAQAHTCAAVSGDQSAAAAKAAGKAAIVAAIKQSFEECDKAYASLTDANAPQMVKTPRGQQTRLGILAGNTTHDTEQYAILSVYMRLKGIVPPSSERPAR